MKYIFVLLIAIVLAGCDNPASIIVQPVAIPTADSPEYGTSNDPRLDMVDAADAKWIRKPYTVAGRGIADADPVAPLCNQPGWAYIFYDDFAVIGYEPFPDAVDIMHRAVAITVELHNRDFPDDAWDYINVGMPLPPPPVVDNDPTLEPWQCALVLDTGVIVQFYQAEFDWEWRMWKERIMNQQLEMYNRDNDPDAHLVWGADK
jgi:hypothetical protein